MYYFKVLAETVAVVGEGPRKRNVFEKKKSGLLYLGMHEPLVHVLCS